MRDAPSLWSLRGDSQSRVQRPARTSSQIHENMGAVEISLLVPTVPRSGHQLHVRMMSSPETIVELIGVSVKNLMS